MKLRNHSKYFNNNTYFSLNRNKYLIFYKKYIKVFKYILHPVKNIFFVLQHFVNKLYVCFFLIAYYTLCFDSIYNTPPSVCFKCDYYLLHFKSANKNASAQIFKQIFR